MTNFLAEHNSSELALFMVILAFGDISLLEIDTVGESDSGSFRVIGQDSSVALIECTNSVAVKLTRRLGGAYKVARVLGSDLETSIDHITYPETSKFNWTVSCYNCPVNEYEDARLALHEKLKDLKLGKGKFISGESDIRESKKEGRLSSEIKIEELQRRILFPSESKGIDFVVQAGFHGSGGKPIFGQTIASSDVQGYYDRDFERPHQDPRITISPRLARILVNLCGRPSTLDREELPATLLDPFCGLGTILQEALCCGYAVIGADPNPTMIEKCKENLNWCIRRYRLDAQNASLINSKAEHLQNRLPRRSIFGIATEPILLPTFKGNPNPNEARNVINRLKQIYEKSLESLVDLLQSKGSRLVFITPEIIDSSGASHRFKVHLSNARPYVPKRLSGKITYPLTVDTTKKRFVQRNLNVLAVD